jgi:flagellar M-ring protein FliF
VIELAKDIIKYSLIAAAMWFVVFRVIKPTFRTLLTALSNMGSVKETPDARANTGAQFSSTGAPYEQNLQVARQIAQQEPKIVASVIKEWVKE